MLRSTAIGMIFGISATATLSAATLEFTGESRSILEVSPEKNTGLEMIYVAYTLDGVQAAFPYTGVPIQWYKYRNLGGGYAEEVPSVISGDKSICSHLEGDTGYIVEQDGRRYCFWITDYSNHPLKLQGLQSSTLSDCDYTLLTPIGEGDAIHYYTVNGQQKTLSRELKLTYTTQEASPERFEFSTKDQEKILDYLTPEISVTPPAYCTTTFLLRGDRFLESWGIVEAVESIEINPTAVAVLADAEQVGEDSGEEDSNVISDGSEGLGGSAPAEIRFTGIGTQAVIHHEWQMAKDPEMEEIEYRFNDPEITYTFDEEGTFYLRYVGSNADGSCHAQSDVFTVNIGASDLRIPNAFSPNDDGVNDIWKVGYRSLLKFECWIFDRYGHQLYHFTDPQQGWDGKKGGKPVKAGVYYYVIQATGADGKKYKKSCDINIIGHRTFTGSNPRNNSA